MDQLGAVLSAALWFGEVAALLYVAYRCSLAFLSLRPRKSTPAGELKTAFLVVVSARDEEAVIGDTVGCLFNLDYPAEKRSLLVIADDCQDATESVARAAGAMVLSKPGPAKGKGSVIQWALAQESIANAAWDAIVLFDADSRPAADFLRVVDGALQNGALVVQGRDESRECEGWIARGYRLNSIQRNRTWHWAREAAGFSAALTGTGVCIAREVVEAMPPRTKTLTEDLEYSAMLTKAGIRIQYLYDAVVMVEQPHSLGSSVHQRLRWARGQLHTTLMHAPGLIWRALRKRDLSALDMALYLGLPSLTPIQAGLMTWLAGSVLAPGLWPTAQVAGLLPPVPAEFLLGALLLTVTVTYVGLAVERRNAGWRDWLAFGLVMVSWLPIAAFAGLTMYVHSWQRTPHGVSQAAAEVEAAAAGNRKGREPVELADASGRN